MKPIHEELHYNQPADEVFTLISTAAFQLEVIAHLGGHDGEVIEETASGDGSVRLVTRQRTGVELPGFARNLIPASTTVTQTYEWEPEGTDGSRRGMWSAEIKGAPVSLGGPTELRPAGSACAHVFRGEVRASVPLVGGKLESFALENLQRDLKRTEEFTAGRLSQA